MITLIMGMQQKIHDASFNRFYNNTVVDYSLQLEAYWQKLRERVPIKLGGKVIDNVVYVQFQPEEPVAKIVPSLEIAQEN